jgi:hypothetical protein
MAGDHELLSSAVRGTTLTVMAGIGFGARGLVYLLIAAFATAAALDFGQQPHGIIDAVQAVANTQLQIILDGGIGAGLAYLAAYFAISGDSTILTLSGQGSGHDPTRYPYRRPRGANVGAPWDRRDLGTPSRRRDCAPRRRHDCRNIHYGHCRRC